MDGSFASLRRRALARATPWHQPRPPWASGRARRQGRAKDPSVGRGQRGGGTETATKRWRS
eukprot:1622772-Rhodomonas_salina.1